MSMKKHGQPKTISSSDSNSGIGVLRSLLVILNAMYWLTNLTLIIGFQMANVEFFAKTFESMLQLGC